MMTRLFLLLLTCLTLSGCQAGENEASVESSDRRPASEDLVSVRVSYFERLASSRLRLTLDRCGGDYSVDVDETNSEIRVGVVAPGQAGVRLDCADQVTVALDEPLGDRSVVDAGTDAAISQVLNDP